MEGGSPVESRFSPPPPFVSLWLKGKTPRVISLGRRGVGGSHSRMEWLFSGSNPKENGDVRVICLPLMKALGGFWNGFRK